MYCKFCGKQIAEHSRSCRYCGKELFESTDHGSLERGRRENGLHISETPLIIRKRKKAGKYQSGRQSGIPMIICALIGVVLVLSALIAIGIAVFRGTEPNQREENAEVTVERFSKEQADSTQVPTVEMENAETAPTETVLSEEEKAKALEMLCDVVKGARLLLTGDTNEKVSIYQITRAGEREFDMPLIPYLFAVVDLDNDGLQEVVVDFSNYDERFVLRYHNDNVYGYGFGFRSMSQISQDGICVGSSGAADTDYYRIQFEGSEIAMHSLLQSEMENERGSWTEVGWHEMLPGNWNLFILGREDTAADSNGAGTVFNAETSENVQKKGRVLPGTGELNIRSGPGTEYPQVGRLQENETVVILETQQTGTTQWGHTDSGWVCMDYIVMEGTSAYSGTTSAGTPEQVAFEGYVAAGTGELNIRSGPGTEYPQVGRLMELERVNIFEIQQNGYSRWGHIDRGWINMDYISQGVPSDSQVWSDQQNQVDARNFSDEDVCNKVFDAFKKKVRGHYSGAELLYHSSSYSDAYVTYNPSSCTYTCSMTAEYCTNIFDFWGTSTSTYFVNAELADKNGSLVLTKCEIR